jgi:hypothetical protein
MASIGRHHHLDVDERLRVQTRAVYERVLGGRLTTLADNEAVGGAVLSPDTDVEIFTFDNGASIATFYVSAEQVLSPRNELAELGVEPFDYEDRAHPYFQAPGGQVFRLARG